MKRFYIHIALFISPIVIALILIPFDKRQRYIELENECFDHGLLLYDRANYNTLPVDIAFFGSSHTINAINDTLIEEKLEHRKHVFNFGYCKLGQNINYTLLKMVLEGKQLRTIVVEVREREDRYSHDIFPFIADSKDVLLPYPFFNRDMFSDIKIHLQYKLELFKDKIFHSGIEKNEHRMEPFGYACGSDTVDKNVLELIRINRRKPPERPSALENDFHLKYPHEYLYRLATLCKEKNIKLLFLYIPSYGRYDMPEEYDMYKKYGKVLIAPKEIFEKTTNWSDQEHLNQTGANELSVWVADHLK